MPPSPSPFPLSLVRLCTCPSIQSLIGFRGRRDFLLCKIQSRYEDERGIGVQCRQPPVSHPLPTHKYETYYAGSPGARSCCVPRSRSCLCLPVSLLLTCAYLWCRPPMLASDSGLWSVSGVRTNTCFHVLVCAHPRTYLHSCRYSQVAVYSHTPYDMGLFLPEGGSALPGLWQVGAEREAGAGGHESDGVGREKEIGVR